MAGAEHFRQSMDEAMERLSDLRTDPTSAADRPDVEGEGSALDGQVRVIAGADGRLRSVTIERQAMYADPRVLGDEVRAAVNAAIDDLREAYAAAAQESAPDPDELVGQLQEVQHRSLARLEAFLGALTDSHMRINQQRG